MIFSSKAETLRKFSKKKLLYSQVPELFFFTEKEFRDNPKRILSRIIYKFNSFVAVRSSCKAEDNKSNSMAGYFYSGLNIDSQDNNQLNLEINKVIKSYKNYKSPKNKILIQKMVKNVLLSGVVMTCEKDTFAPYYIIDYVKGSDTTSVTSGNTSSNVTFKYFIKSPNLIKNKLEKKLINFTKEIISETKNKNIDIEFAIDKNFKIHLLQVRPITKVNALKNYNIEQISLSLEKLFKKIAKLQKPHHSLLGNSTAFGIMPDWNPAEMIGIHPKPLALSLYQELITNTVWARQRLSYGYRDLTSNQLMTTFLGRPFIDIRVDFNSWIPNSLPDKIATKLVNFYINKYKKNTHLHDKIEFQIIFTCFNFNTEERLKELLKFGFSKSEIKIISNSLKEITNIAFNEFKKDRDSLTNLKIKFEKVMKSKMYVIDKIYWLIEDCKTYGTLAFAGLARCGFIAIDLLNSLEKKNIISKNDKFLFIQSTNTITSEMSEDIYKLDKRSFIAKYGHLRPNTYDITSLNYSEGYHHYFNGVKEKKIKKKSTFNFKKSQMKEIDKLLQKSKLNITSTNLIGFIKESIKLREYAKYLFSRNVDAILNFIKDLSYRNNISISDIAYLEIKTILYQYYNLSNHSLKEIFEQEIKNGKTNYDFNKKIKLPHNITHAKDIYFHSETASQGNFIGTQDITSKIHSLEQLGKANIKDKIVFIESADPGYDFIFTKKISGLITKFGGANSHMAIRCAELGIPAAIGIGEKLFEKLKTKSTVRLNCKTQKIDFIS